MYKSGLGVLRDPITGNHLVKVCQNKTIQSNAVAQYVQEGLRNGDAVVIIGRPELRKAAIVLLNTLGLDTQSLKDQGQLKLFDAEFLLSSLLINDEIDALVFQKHVAIPIQALSSKYGKVRIFGEMIDLLWQQDKHDTVMQLEDFWNKLFQTIDFSLLCTYSLDHIDPDAYDNSLERICRFHTHLIPIEDSDPVGSVLGGAMFQVFESAWNRVVEKIAEPTKNSTGSTQMPPV